MVITDTEQQDILSNITISGYVLSSTRVINKFYHARSIARTTYNAAIDRHVPFEEGLEYRLTLSQARREGSKLPIEPIKQDKFLPVSKSQEISKKIMLFKNQVETFRLRRSGKKLPVDSIINVRDNIDINKGVLVLGSQTRREGSIVYSTLNRAEYQEEFNISIVPKNEF